jgi:hypothetical protein
MTLTYDCLDCLKRDSLDLYSIPILICTYWLYKLHAFLTCHYFNKMLSGNIRYVTLVGSNHVDDSAVTKIVTTI